MSDDARQLSVDLEQRLVARARAMVGTPWHHQGRAPGAGIDCVGLLVEAGRAEGLRVIDSTLYGDHPDPGELEQHLEANCDRVTGEPHPADIVRMWMRRRSDPVHAALWTGEGTIIHAFRANGAGEVREDPIEHWLERFVDFWRYRIEG